MLLSIGLIFWPCNEALKAGISVIYISDQTCAWLLPMWHVWSDAQIEIYRNITNQIRKQLLPSSTGIWFINVSMWSGRLFNRLSVYSSHWWRGPWLSSWHKEVWDSIVFDKHLHYWSSHKLCTNCSLIDLRK